MKALNVFVIYLCFYLALGHNWLSDPISRANQQQSQTGCRVGDTGKRQTAPDCPGPCDMAKGLSKIPATPTQRGAPLSITWNRHNHPGGFIRFAWSSYADSDAPASFDSQVDRYVCKEIGGCGPDATLSDYSTNGLSCAINLTVPTWVTDGEWSLQWAYFGGWLNAGDYYACVDYTVSGGAAVSGAPAPVFQGGDFSYPGEQACKYYATNALHVCTVEPCTNGTSNGVANKGGPMVFTSQRAYENITYVSAYTPSTPSSTPSTPSTPSSPTPPVSLTSGSAQSNLGSNSATPCSSNSDCHSGVCEASGYCYVKHSSSSLSSGGIAAIVFAILTALLLAGVAVFFYANKREVPYMVPFKGHL